MKREKDAVKISVILPSLNVGKYIVQCMESVLKQSLEELEIICVDAGSTDGTLEVIEHYMLIDPRVRLLISDKKSYGYQLNLGINMAKGKYVGIVETDDFIAENMYELLFNAAEMGEVDFAKGNVIGITDDGKKTNIVLSDAKERTVTNLNRNRRIFPKDILANCAGIYRTQFLLDNEICFNETPGASYQDTGFALQVYFSAERIVYLNDFVYFYRLDNADSSVHSKEKTYCICDEFSFVKEKFKSKSWDEYRNLFSMFFYRKYKRNLERVDENLKKCFLNKFREDYIELKKDGWLDYIEWNEAEKNDLERIMVYGSEYIEYITEQRKIFLSTLDPKKRIIIYGAGIYADRVFSSIEDKSRVVSFLVSTKTTMPEKRGIPCITIDEAYEYKSTCQILIAVKDLNVQNEMRANAEKAGFSKIFIIPYGLFDF